MRMTWLILQALAITALTVAALWLYVHAPVVGDDCRLTHVHDGDTIAMDCGQGQLTARIDGLNAPETRDAQCEAERAAGQRATARLRALVNGADLKIVRQGTEKYGRDLIRLWIDGQDAAAILIREGLAEPYFGGRRRDWCGQ
ncbi:thermonuclease family protein [Paracoccus sp. p4-l81]|uniref:thermonuclease family protein n=1 Tax=Paracoccus sp. p4-l81 TaxID=3342806 RepID=UPI0035B9CB5F